MNFWPFYLVIGLLGACIGSFLNVCIYRLPLGRSISYPPSSCAGCGKRIKWKHNIPILSWLLLRRRAACCKCKIDIRYPIVEALTAFGLVAIWFIYGSISWQLAVIYSIFFCGLMVGSCIDLDYLILPDEITLGGCALGLILSALVPELHDASNWREGLLQSLIGMLSGALLLWSVAYIGKLIFRKEAMGMGDIKLMAAFGAFLGWKATLFILVTASFIGTFGGLITLIHRRKKWGVEIPFGPYLAAAAMIWILGGKAWMQAYIQFYFQNFERELM